MQGEKYTVLKLSGENYNPQNTQKTGLDHPCNNALEAKFSALMQLPKQICMCTGVCVVFMCAHACTRVQ